eukprot:1392986-Amorphochlora_amoeboformis.AAC.1
MKHDMIDSKFRALAVYVRPEDNPLYQCEVRFSVKISSLYYPETRSPMFLAGKYICGWSEMDLGFARMKEYIRQRCASDMREW